ncbi:hypothetical protein SAMN05428989_3059 [Pseudoxanthomonas sp. GM95]|uniref:hypothetical protein n=1 Tax=Pseudoxanthomonas sp. GM95 TaxID=1881043 RepID=UPI0008C363B2|nr:hypothetical protein [Pseudoxanthomonas sp. GM95]SEM10378.1 hypothetical protein SAMN05428989_3059 [Pseudoxanthomonas sp. GM95]
MNRFNWLGVVVRGALRALHWRALLLWWASLSLVALVAALPVYGLLDAQLSHSFDAPRYAHGLDLTALGDVMAAASKDGAPRWGMVAGLFFTVLLWPWLTGVMVAAVRLGRGARLFVLAAEGMREYGRQLRLVLWSLLPLAPFVALGVWLVHLARERRIDAILASTANWTERGALVIAVLLFLLPYVLTELTRARIGTRDDSRSVVVHWWRSLKLYVRRPFAAWGTSLLIGVLGALLLAALGWLRIGASGAGWGAFFLALGITQVTTLALGWLRLARLQVLAQLVDNDAARRAVRYSTPAAPVTG